MSDYLESFFDDDEHGFRLWSKPSSSFSAKSEKEVFAAYFFKYSKRENKWKERYFVLTDKHLIYYKDSTASKIKGLMKLNWVRNEYITDGHAQNKEFQYGVRFIKNMKYSDLWLKDEGLFNKWKSALSKVCIQSDFHGKFNAIKMIGKGSFARVYLVENKENGTKSAVKAFSKDYIKSQNKGKESLVNEIEVMKKLSHPNIMTLEEIHESQNSIYLVMELLEGGELFTYIFKKNGLEQAEYYRIIKSLLEALAYMDNHSIMHRDLKPENMILKFKNMKLEENVLKIVDFGLATDYNLSEYLFKRCGTPGFVAPEVINAPSNTNVTYNAKCDVYSAGIIFYLMLTGISPFEGNSFQEILDKNKKAVIDFNCPMLKRVSPIAIDLLKKMLRSDPTTRPSASECLDHEFFGDSSHDVTLETDDDTTVSDNLMQFQNKYKFNVKTLKKNKEEMNAMSIKFNNPAINGNIDTFADSGEISSQGRIDSFNSANPQNKQSKDKNIKRESIYKQALMQQINQSNFSKFKDMGQEDFDSVDSGLSGDTSDSEEEPRTNTKKSRFGHK